MSEPGAEDIPPAFWNLAEPQTVRRIHKLYEAAGAQVLLTNTFQASAPALERDGIAPSAAEVNRAAVDNARAAHGEVVVGSIGPCGIEWMREDSPEFRAARAAYREQATALLTAGVDAVMLETFCSIRDLQPALAGARGRCLGHAHHGELCHQRGWGALGGRPHHRRGGCVRRKARGSCGGRQLLLHCRRRCGGASSGSGGAHARHGAAECRSPDAGRGRLACMA